MGEYLTIGVAGGSGSGKTTLTDGISRAFPGEVCVVHHDSYYRAHDDLTMEERAALNYDEPKAYETGLMKEQLGLLQRGRAVHCPVYDFTIHNRRPETELIEPKPVILVEGILIFDDPELCSMMDIRVFVDTDPDVRLARRLLRDISERGRTPQGVVNQWQDTVKPMYEQFVEPSRKRADIIIPGGGRNRAAMELLTARIREHLGK